MRTCPMRIPVNGVGRVMAEVAEHVVAVALVVAGVAAKAGIVAVDSEARDVEGRRAESGNRVTDLLRGARANDVMTGAARAEIAEVVEFAAGSVDAMSATEAQVTMLLPLSPDSRPS